MTTEKEREELEEVEMTWRYAILKKKWGGEEYYQVCEEYPGIGYTGPESPLGDTPEELVTVLEMMLEDVKAAIAHKNIIVDGQPYDDYILRKRAKEPTVPFTREELEELIWDETELAEAPTQPSIAPIKNDADDEA